ERKDGQLDLASDTQPLPAGGEQPKVRAGLDDRSEIRSGGDDLFEIVDDEEQLAIGDVRSQVITCPKCSCDGGHDERRVAQSGKADPEDAGLECWDQFRGRLDRETRLARSTRSAQRQ